jgi:hypothetical protein
LTFIQSIYPNPTRGPLMIKLNQFGVLNLEIFDQSGKIIKTESLESEIYKLDLYDYPNGLYSIKTSDKDKNYDARKIILNRKAGFKTSSRSCYLNVQFPNKTPSISQ